MKKRMLMICLAASLMTVAEAAAITFWTFGSGTAQEDDRSAAVSEAYDQATQQANAACSGTVVNVEKTGTTCFGGGDSPYTCTVLVKAACRIH